MIDRIRQLMQYKSLSASQFADGVEVPRAVVSHILSERNRPSLEVVVKILQHHEDISMEWLLMGRGQMLKPLAKTIDAEPTREEQLRNIPDTMESMAESVDEVRNVQKKELPLSKLATGQRRQKEVDKIIVFYTDKTFSIYTPES